MHPTINEAIDEVKGQFLQQYGHMIPSWYELVNWKEPFIISLITFQMMMLLLVFSTRAMFRTQCCLFLIITGLTFSAESINKYGQDHWASWSSQNYFDDHGVFMGIFFSGPLLTIGFIQLISNLKQVTDLIVTVKREELKRKKSQ